jgi:hypothetical protein
MPRQPNNTGPSLSQLFGLGRLSALVMLLLALGIAAVVGAVVFAPDQFAQNPVGAALSFGV